jgi:hypothetical protein
MKPNVLAGLHDFYQPSPPAWTPQTIGWYVVFALLLITTAWIAWRALARWRGSRYRRAAMHELQHAPIGDVPAILKRTALAAFRRDEVARLSGDEWFRFLEAHAPSTSSLKSSRHLLLDLDYRGAALTSDEEHRLRKLAGEWIRGHRVRV